MVRAHFAILLLVLVCGCGTQLNLLTEPTPYGGVQLDAQFSSNLRPGQMKDMEGDSKGWAALFGLGSILDLPLSAAADTLVLPVTLSRTIERGRAVSDPKH